MTEGRPIPKNYFTWDDFAAIPAIELTGAPAQGQPLVSVLMITRNHEPFIAQAIEGVLGQVCEFRFELIIGEDDSSDRTRMVCESFQHHHPDKIRLIVSEQNVGMHRNFARIWHRAQGKYVAFCEGDDYWTDSSKLARQVEWLEHHHDQALCGTYARKVRLGQDGIWQDAGFIGPHGLKENYAVWDLIPQYGFHFSTVCLRKDAIRFPRWLWDVYCVDRPLYLFCAEWGPVGLIPQVTSVYRLHQGGVWAPIKPREKAEKSVRLFEEIDRHFQYRFHTLIKKTLVRILWSYMSQAMESGDRGSAKELHRRARTYGLAVLPLRQRAIVSLRLYAPALYCGLKWLKFGSTNADRICSNERL